MSSVYVKYIRLEGGLVGVEFLQNWLILKGKKFVKFLKTYKEFLIFKKFMKMF